MIKDSFVTKVRAIGGTEEVVSIEATDNTVYPDMIIENRKVTPTLGLIVSSNNNLYGILNASYQMQNLRFVGNFTSAMSCNLAGLSNCDFSSLNFRKTTAGSRIVIAQGVAVDNCKFSNIIKANVRMDLYTGTSCNNCEFDNVGDRTFTLTGSKNKLNKVISEMSGMITHYLIVKI